MSTMIATRDAYGETLAELGAENTNIVALDADLSGSTKTSVFAKKFPERFLNMGITEANMVGTAAGLAAAGKAQYQYAGLYALRLAISRTQGITRVAEFLYTKAEQDVRKSGEKQFDYVDPKNRAVQIEMENQLTFRVSHGAGYIDGAAAALSPEALDSGLIATEENHSLGGGKAVRDGCGGVAREALPGNLQMRLLRAWMRRTGGSESGACRAELHDPASHRERHGAPGGDANHPDV